MSKHSKSKKNYKGGNFSSASEYATQVYGAAGSQQAVPGTNLIQMKQVGGLGVANSAAAVSSSNSNNMVKHGGKLIPLLPTTVGGKKNKNGGNIISDVAVPATLIYANHVYGKKRSSNKNYSKKNRKSRRFRKTYRR
jgi:hypothetical protein